MKTIICFVALGLVALATFGIAQGQPAISVSQPIPAELTPMAYLPFVARADDVCLGNIIVNGSFEAGNTGWYTFTNGTNWKAHNLIGTRAQGFDPYRGDYGA